MMKQSLRLALVFVFFNALVHAQTPCGTDILLRRAMDNAVYKSRFERQEGEVYQQLKAGASGALRPTLAVVTLPVVVHIVHNGGPENISDATVLQGIQQLNEAFANMGYYDGGNGVHTMIQFCMAKRTPQGAATNGITRNVSTLTNMTMETEDILLKDLNRWNPYDYINIWMVGGINSLSAGPGVAGYAYFPSSHGQAEDGIVMESNFLGSSPANTSVLVHEMGHYLGLYHTFEGGCTNDDCLADGDHVCDTPPDQSTAWTPCNIPVNTCSTDANSGFASDQNDMIINYMDYTDVDCYNAFTPGQADRMNWHINHVRMSLLQSQACNDPCLTPITASFTPVPGTVPVGETVNFVNTSTNATQYQWLVNGAVAGNTPNLGYTFSSTGIYTLQLNAFNADPNCQDTFLTSIFVSCDIVADFGGVVTGNTVALTNTSSGTVSAYEWTVYDGTTTTVLSNSASGASYNFPSGTTTVSVCLTATNAYCSNQRCQYFYAEADTANCNPTFLKTYGDAGQFEYQAFDVTPTLDGNLYFCGNMLNGTNSEGVVGKMDQDGNLLWVNAYTGNQENKLARIKTTMDGGWIAVGATKQVTQDGWVVRADASGNVLWSKLFDNGSLDYSVDVYEMPDGNFIVASTMSNYSTIYLTKLSPIGNAIWQVAYPFGYVYDIDATLDGNIIVSGASGNLSFGENDGWYMKINSTNGSYMWGKSLGQPLNDGVDFIMTTSDGGFLMVQNWHDSPSTYDAYVHRTNASGVILWSKLIDGLQAQMRSFSAVENADGSFTVCLQDFSTPADMKLAKLSADGSTLLWSRTYDAGASDYAKAMTRLTDGGYMVIGYNDQNRIFTSKTDAEGLAEGCGVSNANFTLSTPPIQKLDLLFAPTNVSWMSNIGTNLQTLLLNTELVCENPCAVEICDNGIDDDGDGLFDCLDDDCPCSDCHPGDAKVWCFGKNAGLDFKTEPPTILYGVIMQTYEGVASISDANGTLLFYTDGKQVRNRFHDLMPNGSGLSGHPSSTQSAVIVPHPGNNHLFYLFTVDYGDGPGGLRYSVVDMSLDGGNGDIVVGEKDISLWATAEEKLCAVRHCNNKDVWVVSHNDGNQFRAYRVTIAGLVTTPVISNIGSVIGVSTAGYLKFSPNGKMAASAMFAQQHTDLFDFDNENGTFSNYRMLQSPVLDDQIYGVEFSPNSQLLYVSSLKAPSALGQYDLTAGGGDVVAINNSCTELATNSSSYYFGGIQSAPNGKIYVTNSGPLVFGNSLGIINSPNTPGAGCNYVNQAQSLGTNQGCNLGLPTFIASYFLEDGISIVGEDSICNFPSSKTYRLEGVSCEITGVTWKLDGTLLASTSDTVVLNFTQEGTFTLTAQAFNECGSYYDTLTIYIDNSADVLQLGPDISICENGVITLDAGDFNKYRWQNGHSERTFTAFGAGTYWVDVWDLCGNKQSDTIKITLIPNSMLDLGPDRTICKGASTGFDLQGFTTYQWIPATGLTCADCSNPIANPDTTTQYIVIAQGAEGCISLDTILIKITEDNVFVQLDTAICQGNLVVIYNQPYPVGTNTVIFVASAGGGCDTLVNLQVTGLDTSLVVLDTAICSGTSIVYNGQTLTAGDSLYITYSATNGCDSTLLVRVKALPAILLSLAVSDTIALGESYTIQATVSPTQGVQWQWTPTDGLSCTNCLNPTVTGLQTTTYTLTATNAIGCTATASIQLVVLQDCEIYVPNAFTPNSDDTNDRFYPIGKKECVEEVAIFRIYDRWGELVFENEHFPIDTYAAGWDGKLRNRDMPIEVYAYYFEVVYVDGRTEMWKGDVTLLR